MRILEIFIQLFSLLLLLHSYTPSHPFLHLLIFFCYSTTFFPNPTGLSYQTVYLHSGSILYTFLLNTAVSASYIINDFLSRENDQIRFVEKLSLWPLVVRIGSYLDYLDYRLQSIKQRVTPNDRLFDKTNSNSMLSFLNTPQPSPEVQKLASHLLSFYSYENNKLRNYHDKGDKALRLFLNNLKEKYIGGEDDDDDDDSDGDGLVIGKGIEMSPPVPTVSGKTPSYTDRQLDPPLASQRNKNIRQASSKDVDLFNVDEKSVDVSTLFLFYILLTLLKNLLACISSVTYLTQSTLYLRLFFMVSI